MTQKAEFIYELPDGRMLKHVLEFGPGATVDMLMEQLSRWLRLALAWVDTLPAEPPP